MKRVYQTALHFKDWILIHASKALARPRTCWALAWWLLQELFRLHSGPVSQKATSQFLPMGSLIASLLQVIQARSYCDKCSWKTEGRFGKAQNKTGDSTVTQEMFSIWSTLLCYQSMTIKLKTNKLLNPFIHKVVSVYKNARLHQAVFYTKYCQKQRTAK